VTGIGKSAFYDCRFLTDVTIPEGVTSIGAYAFCSCFKLARVTIPSSVTSIKTYAFHGCFKLESVTIPEGVTSIDYATFCNSCNLASVTIPSTVTSIGGYALANCGMTSVTIPEGVTSLGYGAFEACDEMTSVTIPSSMTSIGAHAFWGCAGLTDVTIPSGVTSIGDAAFQYCTALTAVNFECAPPNGLEDAHFGTDLAIRYNGMYYDQWEAVAKQCGWTNVVPYAPYPFPDGGPYKEKVDDIAWMFAVTNGEACVLGAYPAEGEMVIPSMLGGCSVTKIGMRAFKGCTALESVSIPHSVTALGAGAFSECLSLRRATLSKNLEIIGSAICSIDSPVGITGATDVPPYEGSEDPAFATKAEDGVFFRCNRLCSITIPASVRRVADYTFCGCARLTDVVFEGDEPSLCGVDIYKSTPLELTTWVSDTAFGWYDPETYLLPETWNGRNIAYLEDRPFYVPIDVPESWAARYPNFVALYGSDFGRALMTPTGKTTADGLALRVWHDYVTGTDPTDEDDTFRAIIELDESGNPLVSFTPELSEEEAAKRVYTTWGKAKLQDGQWVEVPDGQEGNYNFFKVSVRMK